MTWEEMYELLLDYEVVTGETLSVVCGICGCSTETMENILFVQTGWHSFDGWLEELTEE